MKATNGRRFEPVSLQDEFATSDNARPGLVLVRPEKSRPGWRAARLRGAISVQPVGVLANGTARKTDVALLEAPDQHSCAIQLDPEPEADVWLDRLGVPERKRRERGKKPQY